MIRLRLPAFLLFCILFFPKDSREQIYVAPNGNDANPGTMPLPKATLSAAIRTVREWRRLHDPRIDEGARIILRGGLYPLSEPILIRPEDAGTEKSPTMIEAAEQESPILSGGLPIRHWKKLSTTVDGLPKEAAGAVWVADLASTGINHLNFRQLWVNQVKAERAKDTDSSHMNRILSWNHATQECWIPKPSTADLSKVIGMEMLIHQWWEIAILRIKNYQVSGDSVKLSFHQPESRIQSEHPWPAPWISTITGNSAFWLVNAIQFLNRPGEWYLDRKEQKLYYWPRKGEQMESAQVIAPYLETLVQIKGNIDHPVSNIHFKGISFQHSGWLRPSEQGHVPHQVGMYMTDAYSLKIPGTADKKTLENQAWIGRPAAAVSVDFAHHNSFEQCSFEHLAFNGLDFHEGTHHNLINGNLLKDIGGNAIIAGVYADQATEIHLPYQPSDQRVVCSDETISNNLITDATNEDWGCAGIAAGYVRHINIIHNDVSEVGNTGIAVGWGWSPTANVMEHNTIAYNKIHHYAKHMYDVSGIYTLSAQPRSIIHSNWIDSIYTATYAHDPHHWFYLYTDEGSSGIIVKNNWTPSDKYLRNANGPGNIWENNGPQVSDQIKSSAGLELPYRSLLQERKTPDRFQSINHAEKPTVIELITTNEDRHYEDLMRSVCQKNGIAHPDLYQWKNHLVLYASLENPYLLMHALQATYVNSHINMYRNPFYDFKRIEHCKDAVIAKQWDHILLTANLVKDSLMQEEYLHYHDIQFKEWPELSRGFCHADFQQLQVFKNGRQLMLIISIPKGESLDHLNPRTTENNPRVDEWNQLMKKYQEGIDGTAIGETWVFLKSLNEKNK